VIRPGETEAHYIARTARRLHRKHACGYRLYETMAEARAQAARRWERQQALKAMPLAALMVRAEWLMSRSP
jgi:hypothetical protein